LKAKIEKSLTLEDLKTEYEFYLSSAKEGEASTRLHVPSNNAAQRGNATQETTLTEQTNTNFWGKIVISCGSINISETTILFLPSPQ
jgi:hypothetical protein